MKKHTVACIFFLAIISLSFNTYADDSASPDKDSNMRGVSFNLEHGVAHPLNQEASINPYLEEKVERSTTTDDKEIASSKKPKV